MSRERVTGANDACKKLSHPVACLNACSTGRGWERKRSLLGGEKEVSSGRRERGPFWEDLDDILRGCRQ